MPRRVADTVATLLLLFTFTVRAQSWGSGVDPRVELMSILFRLAGNPEYNQCRVPAYDNAVAAWFAPYRDHEAVRLARGLGIGFEAPVKLAVHVTDVDSLAERVPFDGRDIHLYAGWDAGKARAFLKAARAFVVDAKFKEFLASQEPLYKATNARLREFVQTQADLLWFSHFSGSAASERFVIVPGMANGGPSYAARFAGPASATEIYAIPGVASVDAAGLPAFNSEWRTTMVYELAHATCGVVVDKSAARLQSAGLQILGQAPEAVRTQMHGSWRTLLENSMVHAVAMRYVADHDGPDASRKLARQVNTRSFFWVGDLSDLLGQYQKDRQHYPTLESFMPRVAQFLDDLPPRMNELVARYQPRVISVAPADGAQDVDPGLKEVVVRFSLPMSRDALNKDPRFPAPRFDQAGALVTLPVTLEPNHEYQFPLRWPDGRAFLSADGVPLAPVTVRFRTRAATP